MAKYSIDYACGHGSFEEQLFGKHKDRESRIEWLERNKVCADCYKAKMQAQRQTEQLSAELIFSAFSDGVWIAVTKGDTYSIKDELKAIGCRWKEYYANGDVIGMRAPKKAWALYVAKTPQEDNFSAALQAAMDKLDGAGVALQNLDVSQLASLSYTVASCLAKK